MLRINRHLAVILAATLLAGLLTGCATTAVSDKKAPAQNTQSAVVEKTPTLKTLYPVKINGLWGYVDSAGNTVIAPQYGNAATFMSTGLAWVDMGDKDAFINQKGEVVFSCDATMRPYTDNIWLFSDAGQYGLVSSEGVVILEPEYEYIRYIDYIAEALFWIYQDGKMGVANSTGNVLIQPKYDDVAPYGATQGLIGVQLDGKWGYLNQEGKEVIPPQYYGHTGYSTHTLLHVITKASVLADGTVIGEEYGYFDNQGNYLGSFEGHLQDFSSNGLALADTGKFGYVDKHLQYVIEPQFDSAGSFADNGLAAVSINGKWGYIDKTGTFVIAPQFEEASDFEETNIARVTLNGKDGIIDSIGNYILEPKFDSINDFKSTGEAQIKLDGKIGLINHNGKIILEPQYKRLKMLTGNEDCRFYAPILDDKYGFADSTGEIHIPSIFDDVKISKDYPLIFAAINEQWGLVDNHGQYLIQPTFEDIQPFYQDELFRIKEKGKWGMINSKGNYLLMPIYDSIDSLNDEEYAVITANGKAGLVSKNGTIIFEPQFEECK